ncbi:hypothetical protein LTR08_006444 [Meristemomyces frigidus]|nr:hypothetical protein LTR08_006444 [Meristemomyces frigidus]
MDDWTSESEDSQSQERSTHSSPINQELVRLNILRKLWLKDKPKRSLVPTVVPRANLTILRRSFDEYSPFRLTDEELLVWLRSCDVLPLVKQWKEQCLDVEELDLQLQRDLPGKECPWDTQARQIAEHVRLCGSNNTTVAGGNGQAFMVCTRFARRICDGNDEHFEQFAPYAFGQEERYLACTRVLLTAYEDLHRNDDGFFGALLESELAGLVSQGARKVWEKKYPFEGETV